MYIYITTAILDLGSSKLMTNCSLSGGSLCNWLTVGSKQPEVFSLIALNVHRPLFVKEKVRMLQHGTLQGHNESELCKYSPTRKECSSVKAAHGNF